jgi:hypothetical protein
MTTTPLVPLALAAVLAASPVAASAVPDLAGEVQAFQPRPTFRLRALVPGLAQLDRGETVKGWATIVFEAALLTAALEMQLRAADLRSQAAAQASARAWSAAQRFALSSAQRGRYRDGFLVGAAAVWALSMVDAHLSPGPRVAGESILKDRPLMPIANISHRGLVAGLSLKF